MSVKHHNLKGIVTATVLFAAICQPLTAQTADSGAGKSDESALLSALSEAGPEEAPRLERQLQALWNKSGSAAMDLLLKRGREALESGDTDVAIAHLTALTDHAPDFAEGWHLRASAYFEAGLYGPAVADLEHALALNPNNYGAIFGLGTLLEGFGDTENAYRAYQRAQVLHPHHEDVIKALERLKPEIEGKAL
ncbi:MAG: tetratricopeptide repeat protein [Pseudodonghicola sp.]|nr:tetratricopeptide repeat protein [Pseudodonghicola sp.]